MMRKAIILLVIVLGMGGLAWAILRHRGEPEKPLTSIVAPPTVTVARPVRGTIHRTVELPATVVALQDAKLYAKVSGYLKTVNVDKGDVVHKGQILATIDSPELVQEVAHERENHFAAIANQDSTVAQMDKAHQEQMEAEAQWHRTISRQRQASAEVLREKANRHLALVTYDRLNDVFQRDPGLIARQDLDVAKANLEATTARVVAAQRAFDAAQEDVDVARIQRAAAASQVASLRAQIAQSNAQSRAVLQSQKRAQDMLDYTHIVAPFDGIITGRFLDPGPLVQSAESNAQEATHPVLSMANFDVVRVYVQTPEPDMPYVHVGTPIELLVDELPGRVFKGTVTRTTGELDDNTRTMLTECDLPNRSHILHPGMLAHERLILASHANALIIPSIAVTVDGQKRFVYVVGNDNIAHKIPIQIGYTEPARVEVTSGLKGDEQIIVAGKENVADSTAVTVGNPGGGTQEAGSSNPASEQ